LANLNQPAKSFSSLAVIVKPHPTKLKITTLNIILLTLFGQLCYGQNNNAKMKNTDRYNAGWEKLKEIDGEAGEKVING